MKTLNTNTVITTSVRTLILLLYIYNNINLYALTWPNNNECYKITIRKKSCPKRNLIEKLGQSTRENEIIDILIYKKILHFLFIFLFLVIISTKAGYKLFSWIFKCFSNLNWSDNHLKRSNYTFDKVTWSLQTTMALCKLLPWFN